VGDPAAALAQESGAEKDNRCINQREQDTGDDDRP